MLIRKNTKAFKTILEIFEQCQNKPDREKLIRLYITKAGHSIADRIDIGSIEEKSSLFYEMNYQTVLSNLKSPTHQLQASEEIKGVYFFHSSGNKNWDETPFEFDEEIAKLFEALPDLPAVRKKEKFRTVAIPKSQVKSPANSGTKALNDKSSTKTEPLKKTSKEKKTTAEKKTQPDFHLKHPIQFTALDQLFFRQSKLSKQDVLTYYDQIAEYILPFLKDRPLAVKLYSQPPSATPLLLNTQTIFGNDIESAPGWMKNELEKAQKSENQILLCNDKEHLLLYVEKGCIEFSPAHTKIHTIDKPDHLVIIIDGSEQELSRTIDAALTANKILSGLGLSSLVKTDGQTGLHVYIPLDGKSNFKIVQKAAENICKLIQIKNPNLISIVTPDIYEHGKVSIDFRVNDSDRFIIAPYSLAAGQQASAATPLLWDEVKHGLRIEDFNFLTTPARLLKNPDPMQRLQKKKVNAASLLARLEEHYSFLFT